MKTYTRQCPVRFLASVAIALLLIAVGPGTSDSVMTNGKHLATGKDRGRKVGQSQTRICGTVPLPNFPDQICGGVSANSNQGACPLSDYCCNENKPAVCAATLGDLPAACVSAGNACQMPGPIRACEPGRDDKCIDNAGTNPKG